jgi:hypothetical protein
MPSPHVLEQQALTLYIQLLQAAAIYANSGDRPGTARMVRLRDKAAARHRRRIAATNAQSMPSHSSQAVCS